MAGIYIHIPFCKQACTYCNFHFSTATNRIPQFLEALHSEIELQHFLPRGQHIDTIYFGGGTPSLLSSGSLAGILNHLRSLFDIDPTAEITLEANPDDISREILAQWFDAGINRLSVGIQSFNDEELAWMNRAHNAADAVQCLANIGASPFTNFSCDLIYGTHLSDDSIFANNLDIMISHRVPHLSCYALTKENKTAFAYQVNHHLVSDTNDDKQAAQFNLLVAALAANGYEHYEISNFALPGFRSRHNSNYWKGLPYLGIGPSAHSFNGKDIRQWNVANNAKYRLALQNANLPVEQEVLAATDQLNEYLMISLRTVEGIDPLIIAEKFGKDILLSLEDKLQGFKKTGKIEVVKNNYCLTAEGKFLADGIAAALFF